MPTFQCKARDESGERVERALEASSRREAQTVLERAGLTPVEIREVLGKGLESEGKPGTTGPGATKAGGGSPRPRSVRGRRRRIKRKELMNFSNQLSSALSAGVPILGAIAGIRDRARNENFKDVLDQVQRDLQGGSPLSEALSKHPRVFPPMYAKTIEAGERSSMLGEMLENLAEFLEAEIEMRADVRSAVMYPLIVVCTLVLAISVLILFIVPRFAAFYAGFDAELPLATQLLIGGSSLFVDNLVVALLACGAAVFGGLRALKVPAVRRRVDRILLKVPLIGRLVETAITLHFVQMLGLFTRAGMPVVEGVRTVAGTIANTRYRASLNSVAAGISVGGTMAEGLDAADCLPVDARQMLANGEATGSVERACVSVARHYKKELKYLTRNMAVFIEPLLTLVLAGVVLFVALAAFLPMWDLVKVIGK